MTLKVFEKNITVVLTACACAIGEVCSTLSRTLPFSLSAPRYVPRAWWLFFCTLLRRRSCRRYIALWNRCQWSRCIPYFILLYIYFFRARKNKQVRERNEKIRAIKQKNEEIREIKRKNQEIREKRRLSKSRKQY